MYRVNFVHIQQTVLCGGCLGQLAASINLSNRYSICFYTTPVRTANPSFFFKSSLLYQQTNINARLSLRVQSITKYSETTELKAYCLVNKAFFLSDPVDSFSVESQIKINNQISRPTSTVNTQRQNANSVWSYRYLAREQRQIQSNFHDLVIPTGLFHVFVMKKQAQKFVNRKFPREISKQTHSSLSTSHNAAMLNNNVI